MLLSPFFDSPFLLQTTLIAFSLKLIHLLLKSLDLFLLVFITMVILASLLLQLLLLLCELLLFIVARCTIGFICLFLVLVGRHEVFMPQGSVFSHAFLTLLGVFDVVAFGYVVLARFFVILCTKFGFTGNLS